MTELALVRQLIAEHRAELQIEYHRDAGTVTVALQVDGQLRDADVLDLCAFGLDPEAAMTAVNRAKDRMAARWLTEQGIDVAAVRVELTTV